MNASGVVMRVGEEEEEDEEPEGLAAGIGIEALLGLHHVIRLCNLTLYEGIGTSEDRGLCRIFATCHCLFDPHSKVSAQPQPTRLAMGHDLEEENEQILPG